MWQFEVKNNPSPFELVLLPLSLTHKTHSTNPVEENNAETKRKDLTCVVLFLCNLMSIRHEKVGLAPNVQETTRTLC